MLERVKKSCTCGNTIDDPDVVPEAKYTWWGWILLLFVSYSVRPKEIVFQCMHCGGIAGRTKDPALLEKYKDYSEITHPKDINELKINYKKSSYDTPPGTNITGTTLEPQSAKSLEGSMLTLYIIIGSIVFTALVLFALLALVK